MILGIKCEGCKNWTRVLDLYRQVLKQNIDTHYYCDECESKVTYYTTKATIRHD